jgi:N-acetylneuraminic acid mutarotase
MKMNGTGYALGGSGKKTRSERHAGWRCGAYYCLLFWMAIPVILSTTCLSFDVHKPLTFEDRVNAQEAIERVYYNHRIWPKENPGPKPPFGQMMSRTQIVAKVEDYLRKSAALDQFWQRPISAEQLQTEMERMARQTQDPGTLEELFSVLNHDAYMIAECLARPVLSDRLIQSWFDNDLRIHREAREQAQAALRNPTPDHSDLYPAGFRSRFQYVLEDAGDGALHAAFASVRDLAPGIPLNLARFKAICSRLEGTGSFWTLEEHPTYFEIERPLEHEGRMIAMESIRVPKQDFQSWWTHQIPSLPLKEPTRAGERRAFRLPMVICAEFSREPDHWVHSSLSDLPDPRTDHTAVWTGTEMIIWGGRNESLLNSGSRYSPATDTWTALPIGSACPSERYSHSAVWTGSEMIIWGGRDLHGNMFHSGGIFAPQTDCWRTISEGEGCPTGRSFHSALWTGAEMIIWGGMGDRSETTYFNTGARYSPISDSWTPTSIDPNCPSGRVGQAAVMADGDMIIWGGLDRTGSTVFNSGGRYHVSADSWSPPSVGLDCPAARVGATAVWTGSEMLVWGGVNSGIINSSTQFLNTGGIYSPSTDSWTPMPENENTPAGRLFHSAVWTGMEMIIWGGEYSYQNYARSDAGGSFDPIQGSWRALPGSVGGPSARMKHSVVWTGTEMIIWGGLGCYDVLQNSGGRFDPRSESWIATSRGSGGPVDLSSYSAVWTGIEWMIWGGNDDPGGRYYPSMDSWSPISNSAGVLDHRIGLSAVWTGTEIIVWGGCSSYNVYEFPTVGGRYNPSTDTWMATSTGSGCPSGRFAPAVWTGTEMIIWGGAYSDENSNYYENTGGRYNPTKDEWMPTPTEGDCPVARNGHSLVWTGHEMIVWGGSTGSGSPINIFITGGRFNPETNLWTGTSTGENCPQPRLYNKVIWSGSEMIIWGGWNSGHFENTGGKYDPVTDKWTATSIEGNCPSGRTGFSLVWTGTEMIVWGGTEETSAKTNSGGRYDPLTDTWQSTSLGNYCPSPRMGHVAAWTDFGMLVWGGVNRLSTGGILRFSSPHVRPVGRP